MRSGRWLPPVVIGLAAAFLRLWQHDLTPFLDDEPRLLNASQELLRTGHIPLTSGFPTSAHFNEPPLAAVLTAIPMLISQDAIWVAGCLALADAIATVIVYLAARELGGDWKAVVAATLYAVAPAAIYFSRRIEYAALVPLFVALALWMCIRTLRRRTAPALAVGLVAAACATELHASAAAILLVWLCVAVVVAPKLKSFRPVLAGMSVVVLTLAPYLYLQLSSGWADVRGALAFAGQPKVMDLQGPETAATLLGGGTYAQLLAPRGSSPSALWLEPPGWILVVLVIAGAALSWRYRGAWPVVALLILPALITLRHPAAVLPYYMIVVVPAGCILVALALAAVPLRAVGGAALALIASWQLWGYLHFHTAVAADGPSLEIGMPLRFEDAAARALPALPEGSRIFIAQEGNQQFSFDYLTGHRYRVTNSDSRYGLPLPAESSTSPAYYIVQPDGPPYRFLNDLAAPVRVIDTTSGAPAFGLFAIAPSASRSHERLPGFAPTQASFRDILQVTGYSASDLRGGQPSPALVVWKVLNPNAQLPSDVQQFAHLVGPDGHTWSTNPDERAYPTSSWQAGDTVLTWFQLAPPADIPTGGYWLETGFYGYPGAELLGPPLRVGPLRVSGMAPPAPGSPLAAFGGELTVLEARREANVVTLLWQAIKQPSANYTAFVHVLDGSGRLVAQDDSVPQAGAFPTTLWRAGDVVSDTHLLTGDMAPGSQLEIGLYTRPDLKRVARSDGNGDAVSIPVR